MSDRSDWRLARWQSLVFFLLGAVLFDGLAVWIMLQSQHPLSIWHACALVVCVGAGAWLSVLPFRWDAEAAFKLEEQHNLQGTLAQIQNLEKVATQISHATAAWQIAQEHATKSVEAANGIAERMSVEARAFADFMQKANDSEKATLRLEVEKLRRAEADWLQVLVRMLDHTYALHQAAQRSGQPALAQNVGQFQSACRDAARRIGLAPFAAAPGEPFDDERHQSATDQKPPADAVVADTIATGYTFQGQLVRRAVVALQSEAAAKPEETSSVTTEQVPADAAAQQSLL